MKNTPNEEPITSKEFFALMRLLQTLEDQGEIPGSDRHDWQAIYNKLAHQCCSSRKQEQPAPPAIPWEKLLGLVLLKLQLDEVVITLRDVTSASSTKKTVTVTEEQDGIHIRVWEND